MNHALANLTPLDVLMCLPADRPVFVLHSGACVPPFARYSIIAQPRAIYRYTDRSEFFRLSGDEETFTERELRKASCAFTHEPLHDLQSMLSVTSDDSSRRPSQPFPSGWIGMLGYELGAVIEPAAKQRGLNRANATWPLVEIGWCPSPIVFDHVTGEWSLGAEQLRQLIAAESAAIHTAGEPRWRAGSLQPSVTRETHLANIARTIEHIRAGDIFQANITQQFTARFEGNTRALARDALIASSAWYGAMLELWDGRTLVSMSPELFLAADHHKRTVMTRPIKGTLPRSLDAGILERSEKDQAELAMIVDLMRNDLGRVCEIGSIKVTNPRTIETHGAVHQGVGEVAGTLPRAVTPSELLRATFPPGSVTGCPKIRAMQIIDELEIAPRGPYCGAIGFISGHGTMVLNVAIRTIALQGERPTGRFDAIAGTLSYGAGGGIIVDSVPESEWDEALAKTQLLRELIARAERRSTPAQ